MIQKTDLISIGKFNKPHGIHGEISFTFTNDIFDRLELPYVICEMDQIYVPFFLDDYRFRSENSALVALEDIRSEIQAKALTHKEVFIEKRFCDDVDEMVSENEIYKGYKIIDSEKQLIGTIQYLDDSTINLLFVVEFKGTQRLIPAAQEWIIQINSDQKIILMNLPEGILDLE